VGTIQLGAATISANVAFGVKNTPVSRAKWLIGAEVCNSGTELALADIASPPRCSVLKYARGNPEISPDNSTFSGFI